MSFPVLKQRFGYRADLMKRGYITIPCLKCNESTMHRPIKVRERFKDTNVTREMKTRYKCNNCGNVRDF